MKCHHCPCQAIYARGLCRPCYASEWREKKLASMTPRQLKAFRLDMVRRVREWWQKRKANAGEAA